jgi:electron transport complex protein RnfE
MGRVESFASKRTVGESALDALGMGLGYLWVLTGISFVRELLGYGTLL